MILRLGNSSGLDGMGDDAGTAGKTLPELATELKDVLDQVETNDQAKALGTKAYEQLSMLMNRLGLGIQAGMVQDSLRPTLDALAAAVAHMPFFGGDQPVGDEWFGDTGLRRAIQNATAATWSLLKNFPQGSLDAEEAQTFVDGFADTLKWELGGITGLVGKIVSTAASGLTDGLGIPSWALWAGAGVAALLLLPKLNQLRKAVLP